MNILVIHGSPRAEGTTTQLVRAFMEGAQSVGAETELVMLRDKQIAHCTNCLKCYAYEGEGVAPCSLQDDMDSIIADMVRADGVCFASSVHCGFVTSLMTTFMDRLAWRAMRPGAPLNHMFNLETRMPDKVRALASIVTAGGIPGILRRFCDDGTRWMKSNAPLELNGQWIGDMYAAAELERLPENDRDWKRLYTLRRLSTTQLEEARALGIRMVDAIESGRLKPETLESALPVLLRWAMNLCFAWKSPYKIAR